MPRPTPHKSAGNKRRHEASAAAVAQPTRSLLVGGTGLAFPPTEGCPW